MAVYFEHPLYHMSEELQPFKRYYCKVIYYVTSLMECANDTIKVQLMFIVKLSIIEWISKNYNHTYVKYFLFKNTLYHMVASIYCIWTLSKSDNKLLTFSTLCIGTSYSTCFVCLSVCYLYQ